MSTLTIHTDPITTADLAAPTSSFGNIDITADTAPGFGRLVRTELRKMTDTLSGRALVGVTALASIIILTVMVTMSAFGDYTFSFGSLVDSAQISLMFLLPSIVILLVTSEWTQRSTMTTFTLVPNRGRVLAAKFAAAMTATLTLILGTLAMSAIATLVSSVVTDIPLTWNTDLQEIIMISLPVVWVALMAFAFAVVALNSAAGLVGYYLAAFALPMAMMPLYAVDGLSKVIPWIDPAAVMNLAYAPSDGSNWAHLAVSALIWIVVPMSIGVRRVLTDEIK